MQTVAVAAVGTYAWLKLRREGIGGHIAAATIRLALVAALLIVLVANNLDLPMDLLDRRDDGRTRGKRR